MSLELDAVATATAWLRALAAAPMASEARIVATRRLASLGAFDDATLVATAAHAADSVGEVDENQVDVLGAVLRLLSVPAPALVDSAALDAPREHSGAAAGAWGQSAHGAHAARPTFSAGAAAPHPRRPAGPDPAAIDALLRELAAASAWGHDRQPLFRGQASALLHGTQRNEALQAAMYRAVRAAEVRVRPVLCCVLHLTRQYFESSRVHAQCAARCSMRAQLVRSHRTRAGAAAPVRPPHLCAAAASCIGSVGWPR